MTAKSVKRNTSTRLTGGRQNSLRRVKDSTDVLRERSLHRRGSKNEKALEDSSKARDGKGRQFTVANVGGNGMLYLRPVQKVQTTDSQSVFEPPSESLPPSARQHSEEDGNRDIYPRDSVWTQASAMPRNSTGLEETTQTFMQHSHTISHVSTSNNRTLDETSDPGTLRNANERTNTATRNIDQGVEEQLSLEVPIPHYRLGTPRFSARGTAFLHHSVHTQSSNNVEQSDKGSSSPAIGDYGRYFSRPPGVEATAVLSRRHSHASPQPFSFPVPLHQHVPVSNQTHVFEGASAPSISPDAYNLLALNPDDPAIVKYSPINGDIIAATPARIIVQITSEAFLDYELLSDFFLTVRAYMSTDYLLSLLLARFEWAIHRFDDNGRVIRVRAFAALRHWILNYFSYDFVIDRELRVKFCERINTLSRLVKGRGERGASDLKLIADLKKCWNGRCSLFWDSPPLAGEGLQEIDIQAGGIVGSRDSQLVHQSQLRFQPVAPQPGTNPIALTTGSTSIANWYTAVMEHNERQTQGHTRHASGATSRSLPLSPSSEQSVPVLSCSIPAKGFKRAYPYVNKALGIHPIPTTSTSRRLCPAAPSSWSNELARRNAEQRRSGSFSDAARDRRAPLSAEVPSGAEHHEQDASLSDRSLLRGHYIGPGGPYVSAMASTLVTDMSKPALANSRGSIHDSQLIHRYGGPRSPAKKSFMGNIRRALSTRHGGPNTPQAQAISGTQSATSTLPSLGKSASVPLNVMFQATSSGQLESYRSIRVDLLAAEIYDSFRQATAPPDPTERHSIGIASIHAPEQPSPVRASAVVKNSGNDARLRPPEPQRLDSAMTDSSQSILIVDDTGLNMLDVVPDSKNAPLLHSVHWQQSQGCGRSAEYVGSNRPHSSSTLELCKSTPQHQPALAESTAIATSTRQNVAFGTASSHRTSLRRYTSYQSTFTKRSMSTSDDVNNERSGDVLASTSGEGSGPARMLRRRPGGDLRANHNVHDLEIVSRPRSVGSVTTYTDSVRVSDALGFGEKIAKTFNGRRSSRIRPEVPEQLSSTNAQSLARSNSSQPPKRRASFEAAVAQFASIPDDEDNEGGIEATLLKLEGKYKSPIQSPIPHKFPDSGPMDDDNRSSFPQSSYDGTRTSDPNNGSHEGTVTSLGQVSRDTRQANQITLATHDARGHLVSTLYAGSDDSYNSVPLLERDSNVNNRAVNSDMECTRTIDVSHAVEGMSSGEIVQETSSLHRLRHGSVAPTVTTDSFLLDENDEFLSETSSGLSLETIEAENSRWPLPDARPGLEDAVLINQHHPPPSPPMTVEPAESVSPRAGRLHQQQNKPPTPDPSPVSYSVDNDARRQHSDTKAPVQPRHMPFILGCEPEVLAQQFTLVEKDALKEVDWRDLVDMRWQNAATCTTNWVDYLLAEDPLGIDLVTARFNIMVKWALSEIVLTENIEERALTIMKYIHIAQQCRKINNYATLLQFTIALTSADCTRLSKTWDRVPEREKDILQDLEMLVSPRRNFQNLRSEMERANADQGCIPVVGMSMMIRRLSVSLTSNTALYIHDLTYNAQKPSHLPGALDGEPLINFERYRSTAVIVKNLLRLIDASTKYNFGPLEGIIERCLWMACLTDEMINHRSRQLEYKSPP
jgi:hypothetical protein